MAAMFRLSCLILVGWLLAGCASDVPPEADAAAPGAMKFHIGGTLVTGVTVAR